MVIWFLDKDENWFPREIAEDRLQVGFDGDSVSLASAPPLPLAEIFTWRDMHHKTRCVLFPYGADQTSVNGTSLFSHKVLKDRDEIVLRCRKGKLWCFFSAEALPRIRPYAADSDSAVPVFCIRCKGKMEVGQPAIQCPQCSLWYHQNEPEQKPCWSYDAHCVGCRRPTTMDYSWKPEAVARSAANGRLRRLSRKAGSL
jgi:hypothetical protein